MERYSGLEGWSVSRNDGIATLSYSPRASLRCWKVLLQFRQHFLDFRPLRHGVDLRIVRDAKFMVLAERPEHLKHLSILIFRQQVYLQFQVVALIGLNTAAVLTHEDEERGFRCEKTRVAIC